MWYDFCLVWNLSNYFGLMLLSIILDMVWMLDVMLYNGYINFFLVVVLIFISIV